MCFDVVDISVYIVRFAVHDVLRRLTDYVV